MGVNSIHIVGLLGKEPDLRYCERMAYCFFTVAVSGPKKDSEPTWFAVKAFDKTAENCGKYLHKGDLVYIRGSMRNERYEKNGAQVDFWCLMAESVQFLETKNKTQATAGDTSYYSQAQAQYGNQQPQQQASPQFKGAFIFNNTSKGQPLLAPNQ